MKYFTQQIAPDILRVAVGIAAPAIWESYVVPAERRTGSWKAHEALPMELAVLCKTVGEHGACFRADPQMRFYGLGQQQEGTLEYHGRALTLKHSNTTIAMPLILTNRGYGLYWDCAGRVQADFTCPDSFSLENLDENPIDFYLIRGETLLRQLQLYWELTGPAVLLPRYTFGFWQSKMRYTSQEELLQVARTYRQKGYPLDILVIDFYHWTEMGDFKFDPHAWPDPESMLRQLRDLHVQTMVSIWPYFSEKSKHFRELEQRSGFVHDDAGRALHVTIFNGETAGLYDPFEPAVRRFVWEKARGYFEQGASISWLDSCEPDDGVNLEDFRAVGIHTADGSLQPRINAYALEHCRGFYEGQRRDFPMRRVLTLARSAFSGCQRYGVTVWSGDIGYDYRALRCQITAGLSAAMSGLPFWTTDIGGFQGGDPADAAYRQLYLRWFQYGAFCPMLRVHGCRGAQGMEDLLLGISRGENELWSFGEEAEAIMAKYLRWRYRLLPYFYSAAWQTITTGVPMMRPLVLAFGEECEAISDAFMLGDALLVCPVLEADAKERRVYLPSGCLWYELETGAAHAGGQWIAAEAPLDRIPVFIKSGTVLPIYEEAPLHALELGRPLSLQVYTGTSGELKLYEDDGISWDYEKGAYSVRTLTWNETERQLTVEQTGEGRFAAAIETVRLFYPGGGKNGTKG